MEYEKTLSRIRQIGCLIESKQRFFGLPGSKIFYIQGTRICLIVYEGTKYRHNFLEFGTIIHWRMRKKRKNSFSDEIEFQKILESSYLSKLHRNELLFHLDFFAAF